MTDLTVAQTILEQLGGNRFRVMTGAKHLSGDKDSLTFKLPMNLTKGRINWVRITLKPQDFYEIEYMSLRAGVIKHVHTSPEVYVETLRSDFETNTGLRTSLT